MEIKIEGTPEEVFKLLSQLKQPNDSVAIQSTNIDWSKIKYGIGDVSPYPWPITCDSETVRNPFFVPVPGSEKAI